MNNLLPSSISYHEKYDLKGSTYKRRAGSHELTKKSPTFKDLDFMEKHPEVPRLSSVSLSLCLSPPPPPPPPPSLLHSLSRYMCGVLSPIFLCPCQSVLLAHEKFEALERTVDRDCKVLQSFGIMDYSLLVGIHNMDAARRELTEVRNGDCVIVRGGEPGY